MDTEQYERSDYFFIELGPPIWAKKMSGFFLYECLSSAYRLFLVDVRT
ncbi:hypothetical protein OESDEN_10685 [Oesophagostomum dentatum]|uniref:Uncharacterized protein n=1 Tax=Oesophagostomum dentatum TaxID=61180 RepID=A0A0B1SVZ6_OESDE|nr:hypothetical protein OESDEN_10685 [Oesophagostomum dentatum]